MFIPFTRLHQENNKISYEQVERPDGSEIALRAAAVGVQGGRFTIEDLGSGEVKIACEDSDKDIACQISERGIGVTIAIDNIINTAYSHMYTKWEAENSALECESTDN